MIGIISESILTTRIIVSRCAIFLVTRDFTRSMSVRDALITSLCLETAFFWFSFFSNCSNTKGATAASPSPDMTWLTLF